MVSDGIISHLTFTLHSSPCALTILNIILIIEKFNKDIEKLEENLGVIKEMFQDVEDMIYELKSLLP